MPSTPTRLVSPRLVPKQGKRKTIMKKPAPLPITQRTIPNLIATQSPPARVRFPKSAEMVTTFSKPATPKTPMPFSSLQEQPLTPLPVADPRSPKPRDVKQEANLVTFSLQPPPKARVPSDLGSSLSNFPRTPYPSAPVSPLPKLTDDIMTPRPILRSTTFSGESTPKARKHGRVPAPLPGIGPVGLAPQKASVEPSPLDLNGAAVGKPRAVNSPLAQAFWQSFSLMPGENMSKDAHEAFTPLSGVPPFVFGTRDGMLWSPGLPRKTPIAGLSSILSPGLKPNFADTPTKKGFLSPEPKDNVANLPTISSVLEADGKDVQHPPSIVVEC